jgi:hypothetical protein
MNYSKLQQKRIQYGWQKVDAGFRNFVWYVTIDTGYGEYLGSGRNKDDAATMAYRNWIETHSVG